MSVRGNGEPAGKLRWGTPVRTAEKRSGAAAPEPGLAETESWVSVISGIAAAVPDFSPTLVINAPRASTAAPAIEALLVEAELARETRTTRIGVDRLAKTLLSAFQDLTGTRGIGGHRAKRSSLDKVAEKVGLGTVAA